MFLFLVVIIAPPPPTYAIQDLVLRSNAYWIILEHLRFQLVVKTGPNLTGQGNPDPTRIMNEIHKYCLKYVKYLVPEPHPFKRPSSEPLKVTTLRLQMYVPLRHC